MRIGLLTGFCGNLACHLEIITRGKDAELNMDFSYVSSNGATITTYAVIFFLEHTPVSAYLLGDVM